MMRKTVGLISSSRLAAFPLAFVVCLLLPACQQKATPPVEKVTFAYALSPSSALQIVASEKGFFREEGLEVTPRLTQYGKQALDALIAGDADFAISAETPVMFAALKGESFLIVAETMNTSKSVAIVALRSRGVTSPADLKGKKVGFIPGTNLHYFLDSFLLTHNIPRGSVANVILKPEEMSGALRAGKVDAVAVFPPFISALQRDFGADASMFLEETIYTWSSVVTARKNVVSERPEAVKKLIRAMLKAHAFIDGHPVETADIVARVIGLGKSEVEISMKPLVFRVKLSQPLLVSLEDQARWAIREKLTDRRKIPDFSGYIYVDGIKAVKPEAVTVVH